MRNPLLRPCRCPHSDSRSCPRLFAVPDSREVPFTTGLERASSRAPFPSVRRERLLGLHPKLTCGLKRKSPPVSRSCPRPVPDTAQQTERRPTATRCPWVPSTTPRNRTTLLEDAGQFQAASPRLVAPGVLAISDSRRDSAALRLGWRNFLARTHWDHVVHLTTRLEKSDEDLLAEFRRFARRVTRVTQCPVQFFVAVEDTHAGRGHLHALLAGTSRLLVARIGCDWKLGHSQVKLVTEQSKAIGYTTKHLDANAPDRLDFHLRH